MLEINDARGDREMVQEREASRSGDEVPAQYSVVIFTLPVRPEMRYSLLPAFDRKTVMEYQTQRRIGIEW